MRVILTWSLNFEKTDLYIRDILDLYGVYCTYDLSSNPLEQLIPNMSLSDVTLINWYIQPKFKKLCGDAYIDRSTYIYIQKTPKSSKYVNGQWHLTTKDRDKEGRDVTYVLENMDRYFELHHKDKTIKYLEEIRTQ